MFHPLSCVVFTTLMVMALVMPYLVLAQDLPSRLALESFCRPESSNKYAACTLMLRGGCQLDSNKPYCNTLSLYHALCAYDNPPDAQVTVCQPYTTFCSNNPTQCQSPANKAWPGWLNSAMFQYQVYRMCSVHNMEGCDRCARPAQSGSTPLDQLDPCDSLATYVVMCKAMPDMTACSTSWKPMCRNLNNSPSIFPNICASSALSDDVDDETGDSIHPQDGLLNDGSGSFYEIPPMRMYFHQDINDILLFRAWVTHNKTQYWFAALGVAVATFGFSAWVYVIRRKWIPIINTKLAAANMQLEGDYNVTHPSGNMTSTALPLASSQSSTAGTMPRRVPLQVRRECLIALRALLLVIELCWSYILMLIVMVYNWGWIGAFILGAFAGNMVFNRDAPVPKMVTARNDEHDRDSISEDGKNGLLRQATCC